MVDRRGAFQIQIALQYFALWRDLPHGDSASKGFQVPQVLLLFIHNVKHSVGSLMPGLLVYLKKVYQPRSSFHAYHDTATSSDVKLVNSLQTFFFRFGIGWIK